MHRQATAQYWINRLALQPHPEGGYFREIYRSKEQIKAGALPARYGGPRAYATAIYFLLAGAQVSTLHRLASDEQWHFYAGRTLLLCMLAPDGTSRQVRLGRAPDAGDQFQAVIPAGTWMGARLADSRGYALIGCTVAPGFDFRDFKIGKRADLLKRFPRQRTLITALTGPGQPAD